MIFDTAIQVPDIPEFKCPTTCVNSNTCLSFTTDDNLNFETHLAVNFNASLPENQDVESEMPLVMNGKNDESGDGKVCFNGDLFDQIPKGATITFKVIRSNYFKVIGSDGKPYKIYAYIRKEGTTKYCPSS